MKHLWLILLTSFSLAWAQDLNLKKNNITVTIVHDQIIEVIYENNDVFNGRFLNIEKNNIIVEGSYHGSFITIPFNQVKMITLQYSHLDNLKGFVQGALTCGGFTIALVIVAFIALDESSEEEDFLKFSSADAFEAGLIVSLPAALLGGALNAMRIASKGIKASYKIDQDNWQIVVR